LQQIHINRLGVNSIEFEIGELDIPLFPGGEHSFELVIINYGSPTHVNLSVDPHLEEYVTFLDDNPYVTHEEYVPVVVRLPYDGKLFSSGNVFIMVGYGSKKDSFTINIGQGPKMGLMNEEVLSPSGSVVSFPEYHSGTDQPLDMGEKSFQALDLRKLLYLVIGIVFLIAAYLLIGAMSVFIGENSLSFGFYSSIFLSIIFIAAAVYLVARLPLKNRK
jgi:hypothetical protein